MRNRAKGVTGYIIGAITQLDMEALYLEEVVALQTIQKLAKKVQRDWKKEIPK